MKYRMPKHIILILVAVLATGCVGKYFSDESIFAPKPFRMTGPDTKNASPEYLKGWDDGCKTGLATLVSGYYKSFYKFKQDPYMISNQVYFKAWNDAYTYCREYAFRYSWDAWDRTNNQVMENQLCLICPNESTR